MVQARVRRLNEMSKGDGMQFCCIPIQGLRGIPGKTYLHGNYSERRAQVQCVSFVEVGVSMLWMRREIEVLECSIDTTPAQLNSC